MNAEFGDRTAEVASHYTFVQQSQLAVLLSHAACLGKGLQVCYRHSFKDQGQAVLCYLPAVRMGESLIGRSVVVGWLFMLAGPSRAR